MSKESKLTRFVSAVAVLLWLAQSMAVFAASRPGDLDPAFAPGAGLSPRSSSLNALVIQDDGKIIIGGGFTNYNGTAVANIARLDPDGRLDTNYLASGGGIFAMQPLADGKLLIGGSFSEFGGVARDKIAKLNADGSVDPTFVPQGGFKGTYPEIFAIAVQPDGKIIGGGTFELATVTNVHLVRWQADGTVDTSFSTSNLGSVLALAVQPDGKILLGGTFGIRRVNPDGTPDASFGPVSVSVPVGTAAGVSINAIHLYQDGRILIAGYFSQVNRKSQNNIARLTPEGALDGGFDCGTGADGRIRAMLVESNGQIIVGGSFSNFNAFPRLQLARLLPDGRVDLGFRCAVESSGLTNRNPFFFGPYALGVQSDGKVILAGTFDAVNGTERPSFARIFGGDSPNEAPQVLTSPIELTVSEGTNVTLTADFSGVPFPTVQWLHNGSVIPDAIGNTLRLHNILRNAAGDYMIGLSNNFGVATGLVARLTVLPAPNLPGSVDVAYDPGEALVNPGSQGLPFQGIKSSIRALAVQPNGSILATGWFSSFNGVPANGLVRLNHEGILDGTFLSNAMALNSTLSLVDDVLIQPDGKILVAGNYTREGVTHPDIGRLSRLNADGTIDSSFTESVEAEFFAGTGFRVARYPDGKILLTSGNLFLFVDGKFRPGLTRLNSDGSPDTAFNPDAGITEGFIKALCIQNDGRALVGGNFSMFNGAPQNHLVRLNIDGTLDTSFSIGTGPDSSVYALRMQPDGKILAGGPFSTFAGVPRKSLARLSADGSLDMDFDPGANVVGTVQAIDLQPDGKILVAGGISLGLERQTNSVVRLLSDGSLDPSFSARSDDVVYDLVRLDDGKIAIGGAFSRLENVLRNGIAVLHGDPHLTGSSRTADAFTTLIETAAGRTYTLEFRTSLDEETWVPLPGVTGNGSVMTIRDPGASSTQRFYRVRVD